MSGAPFGAILQNDLVNICGAHKENFHELIQYFNISKNKYFNLGSIISAPKGKGWELFSNT